MHNSVDLKLSSDHRIKLFFGKEYGLEISSQYQVGTTVKLVVPLIEMKDEEEDD